MSVDKFFTETFGGETYPGETISAAYGPVTITAKIEHDYDTREPWKEHDGHGPVSDWTRRAKNAGEMVLHEDRGVRRYYDFADAVKIARRDGWNCRETIALQEAGQTFTAGEIAHRAAMANFNRLRAWCNDEWSWIGVVVTIECDGVEIGSASLWGIESDAGEYLDDVAEELTYDALDEAAPKIQETVAALQSALAKVRELTGK